MQEKSAEKCSIGKRLDRLRVVLQTNWSEIAEKIGLSESMIYQVKSGRKELSDKAIYRLEQAEQAAGIAQEHAEINVIRESHVAATPEALLAVLPTVDQLKLAQTLQKRIEALMDQFIIDSAYLAETVAAHLKNPSSKKLKSDLNALAFEIKTSAEFLKDVRRIR